MSAICGVIRHDGGPASEADLDGMLRTLAPLGPDGVGRWAGTAGRCGVAVGAALGRRTPEDVADRQPTESPDGALVLVGDLLIANRAELAPALGLVDEHSVPDSAIVLACYERWGDAMLGRIVGEFAFAIVDRRRGGVLLARDHVGEYPLVVHERRGIVAFASNALALTAFEGVGHGLDVRRAAEVFALVYSSSERTFVEGVRWVPPGGALWIADSGVRRWHWWLPDVHATVDLGSQGASERELRAAFDAAVAARLRTIGEVGTSTSGGLDSASVTATAAAMLAPEPLRAYTSAPPPGWSGADAPGRDADESGLVLKLAERHPNIATSFVHIAPGGKLFDLHEPLWELGSGPTRSPCNILWMHAIQARAGIEGVSTLLRGARGNMHFSADGPDWLATLVRSGRITAAVREARAWATASGEGIYSTLVNRLGYRLLPGPLRRLARLATGRTEPLHEWTALTALRPEVVADLDLEARVPLLHRWRRPDLRREGLRTIQTGASQADGRAAMAVLTGVDTRDPTADRRVLEVAIRQPEWVRRHAGVPRAAVRGAMADRLPPEILHRTRRGEQLPDWLDLMTAARAELASELEQLRDHSLSRELVDVPRLERLMEHWPDRRRRADPRVIADYRSALLHALLVSRYLRWFERRAAVARASHVTDEPRIRTAS